MSPYGDYDTMLAALTDQLGKGHYLLGNHLTAVDLLWGTALNWILRFNLVPALPVITSYAEGIAARSSVTRVTAQEAERASAYAT
ncbi:MAG TPA: glutathione S-transferase C-terminal domain-containing protein [Steroidobacteraceae bacterium]|jgi:glutathione S-transferase|nr:glutathione S-transferase C-terminal domain-containing protein [Steroidobacteraceae bacterium]